MARKLKNITAVGTKKATHQTWEKRANWIAREIWISAHMAKNPETTLQDGAEI